MSLKRLFIQIVTALILVSSNQLFPASHEKNGITVTVTDHATADLLNKPLFSDKTGCSSHFVSFDLFPLKLVVTNNTPHSISFSPESILLDLKDGKEIAGHVGHVVLKKPKIVIPFILSLLFSGVCEILWLASRDIYFHNQSFRDRGYHLIPANYGGKHWVQDNNYDPNNHYYSYYKKENAFTPFFAKWGGWLTAGLAVIGVEIGLYGVSQIEKLYQQEVLYKRVILQPGETIEKILFINGNEYNKDEFTIRIHSLDNSNQETEFVIDWRF